MKQILAYSITLLALLLLPISAMAQEDEFESDDYLDFSQEVQYTEYDPMEPVNRGIFQFNQGVDTVILNPLVEGYQLLPRFARNRVYYVLQNFESPVVFANSLLQGDINNSFVTFWRFIFNSTLGVLGAFDIATELGMPQRTEEDFGQTLGVWGVGPGPYVMLPLIGPSSLRDAPSLVVDIFTNPFTFGIEVEESIMITSADALNTRSRLDSYIDRVNESSLDPYATFRSLYLQRRAADVNNN